MYFADLKCYVRFYGFAGDFSLSQAEMSKYQIFYSYLLNKRACPFIYLRKKFHPRHARLLGFEKNSSLDMIFYVVKKFFHPPRLPNFAPLPVY